MIKKFSVSAALVAVFIMSGSMLFAQDADSALQVLGSFSLGYASNSDMNDVTKDDGENISDYYNTLSGTSDFSSEDSSASFTYGFDVDLRYFFGNFGIGGEIGYHAAEAESKVSGSGWQDEASSTATLTVIPMVATCYYRFTSPESKSFLLVGAGLGLYSGEMKYVLKDEDTIAGDFGYTLEGSQSVIGYHALVEYDLVFDGGLTVFTGLKARYVQFDEFKDGSAVLTYNGDNFEAGLTGISWYLGAGISM